MKLTKFFALLGTAAMSAVLFYGFTVGDFFIDGGMILENPWGIVSLVDLYTGFVLFSIWIVYREHNIIAMILWVTAMMVFGFLTGSIYVLWAAISSKGDVLGFFLGKNKANYVN